MARVIYTVDIGLKSLGLPWASLFSPQKDEPYLRCAVYEAVSEAQQKQAEMWALGSRANSVPRKAVRPLPISLAAHMSHVCAFVTESRSETSRDTGEMPTAPVSCVSVRGPSGTPWARHGLGSSQQRSAGPLPLLRLLPAAPPALRVH